jgi:hypothetical protein
MPLQDDDVLHACSLQLACDREPDDTAADDGHVHRVHATMVAESARPSDRYRTANRS